MVAPDWPGDEGDPVEPKAHPNKQLTHFGPKEIVDHYERLIRALSEAPILMGHSAGGVFVQHLADRGLGVAAVAIDPAPTPGVGIPLDGLLSALPVLSDPFSGAKKWCRCRRISSARVSQTACRVIKSI